MATLKTYRYRNILSAKLLHFFLLLLLCAQALGATEGHCLRVSDGDTITIAAEGRKEKVRLIGIDAPELRQEGGPEARQYLAKRILNRRVKVEGETRDRYGRLLGTVYLGEENINLSLVREGHAWDYKAYSARPGLHPCRTGRARGPPRPLGAEERRGALELPQGRAQRSPRVHPRPAPGGGDGALLGEQLGQDAQPLLPPLPRQPRQRLLHQHPQPPRCQMLRRGGTRIWVT